MQQLDARIISFPLAASKYFHWLFGGLSAALAPAYTGGVPAVHPAQAPEAAF